MNNPLFALNPPTPARRVCGRMALSVLTLFPR
jgi:hypothetical protein